jgi:hypothetical protein
VLGEVHPAQHLDARHQGRQQVGQEAPYRYQFVVDAVQQFRPVLARPEMQVGSAPRDGVGDRIVDHADDRCLRRQPLHVGRRHGLGVALPVEAQLAGHLEVVLVVVMRRQCGLQRLRIGGKRDHRAVGEEANALEGLEVMGACHRHREQVAMAPQRQAGEAARRLPRDLGQGARVGFDMGDVHRGREAMGHHLQSRGKAGEKVVQLGAVLERRRQGRGHAPTLSRRNCTAFE